MKPHHLLLLPLLLWGSLALADYPLEIIKLRSNLPEELLPSIQPLLGPGENISAAHNMLLLRAAPERIEEIRQVIDQLDRPPRKLLITVRRGAAEITRGEGFTSSDGDQRIQTLEGRPAFIHSGSSIAVPERTTTLRGGAVITQRTTGYRDALQGFYVVPRVVSDQVTLEIHQQYDQPGGRRGTIQTQRADSVVSGRLGQWIGLGGISHQVRREGSSLSGYGSRQSVQTLDLQVRVTELP
ncbi:MAG: hypothetical protein A2514_02480 [Gammaproteobacteria bacterium RIFOXYD12_FULL_61_37]|nr:MAG: hypothetical protein A2514_02480 [Gammaproteobacteria bacterium RIFOXYD12_FULL_61_37]